MIKISTKNAILINTPNLQQIEGPGIQPLI